ncbi:sugar transferase [Desulfobacterota bacterium M19]
MIREHFNLLKRVHQAIDMSLIFIAITIACWIRNGKLTIDFTHFFCGQNYFMVLVIMLVVFYPVFNAVDIYEPYRYQTFDKIFAKTVKGVMAGVTLLIFILYMMHIQNVSRLMIGLFVILAILLLVSSKAFIFYTLQSYRKKGFNYKRVLVVGSRERAREMIKNIFNNPQSGYRVIGCLDTDEQYVDTEVTGGVRIIGTLKSYEKIILESPVDEVIFAMPLKKIDRVNKYIAFAEDVGVNIRIMPDWQIQKVMYRPETAAVYFDQFIGMPTIALSSTPRNEFDLLIKTALDYTVAAWGMIMLSPFFVIIAILIKLNSKGPVFFKQERSGLNGRKFYLLKFRTMVDGADKMRDQIYGANEMDGPVFKLRNDPRVTAVGRILRKTSLDELPQLINILQGEMSLVGPRPPLPAEVKEYKPWQRRRLSLKPGLTCIWQVSGRNNIDFETWMKMDLEYIDNWSLLLDLKLLLKTIPAVVLASGL